MTAEVDEDRSRRAPIARVPKPWRAVAVIALVAVTVAAVLWWPDIGESAVAALPRWLVAGVVLALGVTAIAIGVHEPWARRAREDTRRSWRRSTRLLAQHLSLPAFRIVMTVAGIAITTLGVLAVASS